MQLTPQQAGAPKPRPPNYYGNNLYIADGRLVNLGSAETGSNLYAGRAIPPETIRQRAQPLFQFGVPADIGSPFYSAPGANSNSLRDLLKNYHYAHSRAVEAKQSYEFVLARYRSLLPSFREDELVKFVPDVSSSKFYYDNWTALAEQRYAQVRQLRKLQDLQEATHRRLPPDVARLVLNQALYNQGVAPANLPFK